MRRVSLLAVLSLVVIAGSGSPPSSGSGGPRWTLQELGGAAGHRSAATGVSAGGLVVGARAALSRWGGRCFVASSWSRGVPQALLADGCESDLWVSSAALSVTPRGRTLGEVFCAGCSGGVGTYWLSPRLPDPSNSWQKPATLNAWPAGQFLLPMPARGQPARTCRLAATGATICGPYRGLPAADDPKVQLQGCALQNFVGVAVNDRSDVIAYLEECVDAGTGAIYAPASYFLAGPDGWVTFGPHGTGVVKALNARGDVAGAILVPAGGSHAFLWHDRRIVDLGTLGGKSSVATALNDRLEVVGTSTTGAGARHGFHWRNGRIVDLGSVTPLAVNANGAVLAFHREGGRFHVFLWRNGRLTGLGYWHAPTFRMLGEPPRYGLALDDRGRVVGADPAGHAAVWENGIRTRLPVLPGGKASAALAASATGGIAGWSADAHGIEHAVLWTLSN